MVVEELHSHGVALWALLSVVTDFGLNFQDSITVVSVKFGAGKEIKDVYFGCGVQVNIAVNPGHPPVILVFQVTAIGPANDHCRQAIFARADVRGHIELGGQA